MMAELGAWLAKDGWKVTVITGFPNHPKGYVFGGYKKGLHLREQRDGYIVRRVFLLTFRARKRYQRMLTFASFTLSSTITLLLQQRPDVIFAVFQPLSLGATLPMVSRLKGARLVLNIQDLHPKAQEKTGLVKNPIFLRLLRWLERSGYVRSRALTVICEPFRSHCIGVGADPESVETIPNWIDTDEIVPLDRCTALREEMGLSPDEIVVLHAGTIGFAADIDLLLESARRLAQEKKFTFVFVGDGPRRAEIERFREENSLCNIKVIEFQPRARLAEVQATSDVSVAALQRGQGESSVPSRTLGYMAAARPIVMAAEASSESAKVLSAARCGVIVEPGNAAAFETALRRLGEDGRLRSRMGLAGRQYVVENLSKEVVLNRYTEFLASVTD